MYTLRVKRIVDTAVWSMKKWHSAFDDNCQFLTDLTIFLQLSAAAKEIIHILFYASVSAKMHSYISILPGYIAVFVFLTGGYKNN